MANVTYNLTPTKSAYVTGEYPDTPGPTNPSTQYLISPYSTARTRYLLFGFNDFPYSLRRNKLVSGQVRVYVKKGNLNIFAYTMESNWDPSTVTFNNMPTRGGVLAELLGIPATAPEPGWGDEWMAPSDSTETSRSRTANLFVNRKSLAIGAMTSANSKWYIRTVLAGGGQPYVEITYDDATLITSKITPTSYPSGSSVNMLSNLSFAWRFEKDSTFSCMDENWYQASAALYWKTSAESSWHSYPASGGTTSLTVPAGTFPPGATIQWYIQGTDTDGTTSTTTQKSFTTLHSQITPQTYPSGNAVNSKNAITFSWYFTNGFSQRSAYLMWRVNGAANWNRVNASGTTASITVPAYTFPTGQTIEWYVAGTDNYGYSSSSSTYSFTSSSAATVLTAYPSGSDVYTRQTLTFTWDITGNYGSYNQSGAVLYWKKQSSGSYTAFTVSGSNKRASIPSNTFPTGQTIQWYVSATDASGVTTQSSVLSFKTVTPTISPVTYPSGNGINFGVPIGFTWTFSSSGGDHDQQSASFYWRTSTEEAWHSIAASGGTKSVTVPAYTFPSNKTVYWYISGTDVGGTTSNSNQLSFKTASPQITPQNSPTSGYSDPRLPIPFSWYFTDGVNAYDPLSGALRWRVTGGSSWTEIQATGSTPSITVPANTFPTLTTIEWMLTGTDRGGTYSETAVYSFSTTASTAYAVCLRPVGRVEDGTKPITFTWTVRNTDGSAPTRIIMKWKKSTEAATEWRTALDTTDPVMSLTIEADTFSAGAVDWQVIAYNRDGAAGPASLASFVCVAAPDPPVGLMATAVPRTTVRWQSSGQEAYEVKIDGVTVEAEYGPGVYSYQQMEPLPDGVHVVTVRIQGVYGLWSNYAETTINVLNTPDGEISIAGKFRYDGNLSWSYDGSADPEVIAIYRDGKWIGRATGKTAFRDRFALGIHVYRVEYWYADGNYTRSDNLRGMMRSDTPRIGDLSGGEWLDLELSDRSAREQSFSWSRTSAMQRITGSSFPVLEVSPYETLKASYECAFSDDEKARTFEALRGKTVILKSRRGSVLVGGLVNMTKKVSEWYTVYSFTVEQCHWEDFVNDDADD